LSFAVRKLEVHQLPAVPHKRGNVKTFIVTVEIGQNTIIELQMKEISLFSFVDCVTEAVHVYCNVRRYLCCRLR